MGTMRPTWAYVGKIPIRVVPRPMIEIVRRNAYFLPTKSPIRPKTTAPNGRTAKPAAKVASVRRSAPEPGAKNTPDIRVAREPKM